MVYMHYNCLHDSVDIMYIYNDHSKELLDQQQIIDFIIV